MPSRGENRVSCMPLGLEREEVTFLPPVLAFVTLCTFEMAAKTVIERESDIFIVISFLHKAR